MIGYIIFGLTALTALSAPLIMWWLYVRDRPALQLHGFHVRFLPGTTEPWVKLPLTLRHTVAYVEQHWPHNASRILHDVWVIVHKHDDVLTPPGVLPAGIDARKVTGYYETVNHFFGLKSVAVLHIKQLASHVVYAVDGPQPRVLSAEQSALLHEFCEHHLPLKLTGNRNVYHDARWLQHTSAIRALIDRDTSGYT